MLAIEIFRLLEICLIVDEEERAVFFTIYKDTKYPKLVN